MTILTRRQLTLEEEAKVRGVIASCLEEVSDGNLPEDDLFRETVSKLVAVEPIEMWGKKIESGDEIPCCLEEE